MRVVCASPIDGSALRLRILNVLEVAFLMDRKVLCVELTPEEIDALGDFIKTEIYQNRTVGRQYVVDSRGNHITVRRSLI